MDRREFLLGAGSVSLSTLGLGCSGGGSSGSTGGAKAAADAAITVGGMLLAAPVPGARIVGVVLILARAGAKMYIAAVNDSKLAVVEEAVEDRYGGIPPADTEALVCLDNGELRVVKLTGRERNALVETFQNPPKEITIQYRDKDRKNVVLTWDLKP